MQGHVAAHQPTSSGKRIFVIDQSRVIRTLLTINFQQRGHRVISVPTPHEGIERLQSLLLDPPDVIFLAMHAKSLEDQRALAFLQRHPLYARLPLVLMMTREESEHALRPLAIQHSLCLFKPFCVQEVFTFVETPARSVR